MIATNVNYVTTGTNICNFVIPESRYIQIISEGALEPIEASETQELKP